MVVGDEIDGDEIDQASAITQLGLPETTGSAGESSLLPPGNSDSGLQFEAPHLNFKPQTSLSIPHPLREIVILAPDGRSLVGRKGQLEIHIIRMQEKFKKIP